MRARCDGPSWRRLAGAVVVLVLLPAPDAVATFPGRNGGLTVAWSNGDCSRRLVTLSLDGRGSRALTPCGGLPLVDAPDWSADGRRLLFAKDGEVAMMAADGSRRRTLQLGGGFPSVTPEPSFAPDGKRLAYVADDSSGHRAIWISTLGGRATRRLRGGAEPRWSPDGRVIAFRTVDGVFLMHARTGALIRKVAPQSAAAYDWSPDGRRLVYAATGPEFSREIFSVRTDRPARAPRQLTHLPVEVDEPVWSPDGRQIAFVGKTLISESVVYSIWTMTARGTRARQVFEATLRDSEETLPPRLGWRPRPSGDRPR